MANKQKRRPAKNQRKNKSFEQRYGMTKSKWAEFKKTAPKAEIESVKLKARKQLK